MKRGGRRPKKRENGQKRGEKLQQVKSYFAPTKERRRSRTKPKEAKATLNTAAEIKRWIPSLKKDIDFYLKQSKVWCYPEAKITEFSEQIERLRREHQAFIWKLRQLDPQLEVIPWTERAYSNRKRLSDVQANEIQIGPAKKTVKKTGTDTIKNEFQQLACNNGLKGTASKQALERIPLPVLQSEAERQYANNKHQMSPLTVADVVDNRTTCSHPLRENKPDTTMQTFRSQDTELVTRTTSDTSPHISWKCNTQTMDAPLDFKPVSSFLERFTAEQRQRNQDLHRRSRPSVDVNYSLQSSQDKTRNLLGLSYTDSSDSEHE